MVVVGFAAPERLTTTGLIFHSSGVFNSVSSLILRFTCDIFKSKLAWSELVEATTIVAVLLDCVDTEEGLSDWWAIALHGMSTRPVVARFSSILR